MKKNFIFIFIFCFSSALLAKIELISPEETINQGAIIKGALRFQGDDLTKVNRLKLSDLLFEKTLYISSSGSAVRNSNSDYLDVPVTFSFVNVPQSPVLGQKIGEEEIQIDVSDIRVNPSEASPQLILADFEIPIQKEWMVYILLVVIALVLLAAGIRFYLYLRHKREGKKRLLEMKDKVVQASSYEEISSVWQNRHHLLRLYPHVETAFRDFEGVYFKYAFKPSRSEDEIKTIKQAYSVFSEKLQGGNNGV